MEFRRGDTAGRYDEALKYAQAGTRAHSPTPSVGAYYHVGVSAPATRRRRAIRSAFSRQRRRALVPAAARLQILLALLDLRRGRPQKPRSTESAPRRRRRPITSRSCSRARRSRRLPVRLMRPTIVASLIQRAGRRAVPRRALPGQARPRLSSSPSRGDPPERERSWTRSSRPIAGLWLTARTGRIVFMQNAAVYALRVEGAPRSTNWIALTPPGWRDGRTLAIDPFFTSIRAEPRFTQLLSRIASDVAAMRARADMSGL